MNNLRIIRRRLGMTQLETAALLGVTKATVSNYETGRHPMPTDAARKLICEAERRGHAIGFDHIYGELPDKLREHAA